MSLPCHCMWALCGHAINLYGVTLQEQIVKQQSGQKLSLQGRKLKYKARSRVFLTIFEVFGSLQTEFFFSIRTKTKEKPKNKIVAKKSDIQTQSQPWFIMFTLNLLFMSLRSYRMIPNVHISDSSDKGHYTILAFLYWLKSFSSRLNSAPTCSYMYIHWVMVHWFMA